MTLRNIEVMAGFAMFVIMLAVGVQVIIPTVPVTPSVAKEAPQIVLPKAAPPTAAPALQGAPKTQEISEKAIDLEPAIPTNDGMDNDGGVTAVTKMSCPEGTMPNSFTGKFTGVICLPVTDEAQDGAMEEESCPEGTMPNSFTGKFTGVICLPVTDEIGIPKQEIISKLNEIKKEIRALEDQVFDPFEGLSDIKFEIGLIDAKLNVLLAFSPLPTIAQPGTPEERTFTCPEGTAPAFTTRTEPTGRPVAVIMCPSTDSTLSPEERTIACPEGFVASEAAIPGTIEMKCVPE